MNAGVASSRFAGFLKWSFVWLILTLGITWTGALSGALLFPVGGLVLGYDLGIGQMAWNGFKDGGFLAFIWAPGVSLIVCIVFVRNKYVKNADYVS